MLRGVFCFSLFILVSFSQAQLVKVTDRTEVKIKGRSNYMFAMHPTQEKDGLTYVATIIGEAKNVDVLFGFLKAEAYELKANFFEMSRLIQKDNKYIIEWKVYHGIDSLGLANNDRYPWNNVYLFSQFKNARTFIVNGKEVQVPKASFIKFEMDSIKELAIQYGSEYLVPLEYHSNKYQASKFVIAISGSVNFAVAGRSWGMGVKSADVKEIPPCDGWFLTKVYYEFIPNK